MKCGGRIGGASRHEPPTPSNKPQVPDRPLQSEGRDSSQYENNCFTEMCSGSKEGSYLGFIDFGMIQL